MPELPDGTITFLFTDVQDSTRLWESHPEAMQRSLKRHDEIIEDLARKNGGHIVRPRGEGDSRFLVFERALDGIRAAAAIQKTLHAEDWPEDLNLRVRMGVHTGEGEFRDGDYYGTAVNRCARLRDTANGGQTLISQSTYELVQDQLLQGLTLLNIGKRPLKGLVRSENIYQLLAPGIPKEPPFQSKVWTSSSPSTLPSFLQEELEPKRVSMERPVFVGREEELTRLDTCAHKACDGNGQIVFVTGEAGRGKTALIQHFARQAQDLYPELLVAYGESNAQTGIGDPYLPFREVLDMLTGDVESPWSIGRISSEGAARLWHNMPHVIQTILDVGPDLVDMLIPASSLRSRAMAFPDSRWTGDLDAFLERKALYPPSTSVKQIDLFEQYTRILRDLAVEAPLVLILDDFQWADDASISLFFHLARRISDRSILLICAYRPDEVAMGRDGVRHPLDQVVNELSRTYGDLTIDLGTSGTDQGMNFIHSFLDTEPNRLGEDFRQALFNHTGGHPLFTVELLRAMQDRGDLIQDEGGVWIESDHLNWDHLPVRIEAVIKERISRLKEEIRKILSVASVEGKDFTAQIVARIQDLEERKLLYELSQVLSKQHRLVRELGEVEAGRQILSKFQFVHHLFQRYLYNGMSTAERRLLHGDITEALEDIFSEEIDRVVVQLAYHSQRAHLHEKARRYLRMAGDQARTNYANQEAIRYYTDLLHLLPELNEERFEVLSLRSRVYDIMADHQAQEADAEEMLAIADQLEDPLLRIDALLAQADAVIDVEHIQAKEPAEKALLLARELNDPQRTARALRRLGSIAWFKENFAESREYLEKATQLFQQENELKEAIHCLHELSLAIGALHKRPEALEVAQKAVSLSRKVGDRRLEAISLRRLAIAYYNQHKFAEALPIAEEALALHREVGDWNEIASALNVLGLINSWFERWAEAEGILRESLSLGRELYSSISVQFAAWNLSTCHYWRQGLYEDAVNFMVREIQWATEVNDMWLVASLHDYLGWFYYEIGQFELSLKSFETELEILEKLASRGARYVTTLSWIGLQHAEMGTVALAKEYMNRSQEMAYSHLALPDRVESTIIWGRAAFVLGEQDQMNQALTQFDAVIDILLDSAHTGHIEDALSTLVPLLLAQENMMRASELTEELIRLIDFAPVHPAYQDYAYTIFQVLDARGKSQEALGYLERAYHWIRLVEDNFENETWRRSWLKDARRNDEILLAAQKQGIL